MNGIIPINHPRFNYTDKSCNPCSQYIEIIVDELIKIMESHFCKQAPTFRLINDLNFAYPETTLTYDEIHICCMDTSWSQIAYQFSHEFCHLLIGSLVPQKMRWFEESICELSSLFFMEQLAIVWKTKRIFNNSEYATSLISYCANYMNSATDLQNLLDVSDPSSTVWSHAVAECYDRNFNLQIAKLLLPIFHKYPALWKTVPLLSRLHNDESSLTRYLSSWSILSDESFRQPFAELAEALHCSI